MEFRCYRLDGDKPEDAMWTTCKYGDEYCPADPKYNHLLKEIQNE